MKIRVHEIARLATAIMIPTSFHMTVHLDRTINHFSLLYNQSVGVCNKRAEPAECG